MKWFNISVHLVKELKYNNEVKYENRKKSIVKNYGPPVIIGVALALAIGYGWRYWTEYKTEKAQNASTIYQQMLNATTAKDTKAATKYADQLQVDYKSTPYAELAALMEANLATQKADYKTASTKLNWVIDNADTPAVAQVATLRLARIDIQNKQPQKALDLLKNVKDQSYKGLVASAQGDAYIALNQQQNAKSAYARAAKDLPGDVVIKLKSQHLGNA